MVKQQENNDNTHERCQRQYTAGSLFAFELSAILDVVALGQLDSGVYLLLNIIYNTAQVTVGNVGGDNDFPFYIFAVDRVRSHGGNHFRHVVQRNFASVVGVDHEVADFLHFVACVVLHFDDEVEALALFVHLRNHFSCQRHIHVFGKFRQGDAEFRQHFPFGLYLQLRAFDLLLHVEVGNSRNVADSSLDLVAQREHLVQVVSEEFDGDICLRTGQHRVDTVADGLTDFDVCSGDRSEFLAHFGDEFATRAVFQFKRCLDFRNVYAERVFIQFGTSRFAGYGLYFGDCQQQFFGTMSHLVAFFQGYARQRTDIDGERAFIERRKEAAPERKEYP